MLFLLIVLPVAIGFACLKLVDSKQWLQAMIASALLFCIAADKFFAEGFAVEFHRRRCGIGGLAGQQGAE